MRFSIVVRLMGILAGLGVGVWFWLGAVPEPETPAVQFVARPSGTPLETTVVAGARSFRCQQGTCQPAFQQRPVGADVFDGTWYYSYESGEGTGRAANKIFLQRQHSQNSERELIMESTPLTSPRGLFLSPDRTQLAFWLDNSGNTTQELTELWLLDTTDQSIRLLAEKLYQPDVRSTPRWNRAGTALYFVADTGEQTATADQLELIVVSLEPSVAARFPSPSWQELLEAGEEAVADVSRQGSRAALVTPGFFGSSTIRLYDETGEQRSSVRGEVGYLAWLDDERLLYGVQSGGGVTFWQVEAGIHRFLARRPGSLRAAMLHSNHDYLVVALASAANQLQVESIHLESGTVIVEGVVQADARQVAIDQVITKTDQAEQRVAAAITELDDAELVAFVDKHRAAIAGLEAQPTRLVMTDTVNTLFFEYRDAAGQEQRVLLQVHDAIHTEWSITARYETLRGEWRKIKGGGLADPEPLRLYEWEPEVNQWILKNSF